MPIIDQARDVDKLVAFRSTDGGHTYTGPSLIAALQLHGIAGHLRADNLPSAEIDAAGKIYVVWSDCRFRTRCTSNDLVMSTTANGTHWSTPARIPIDLATSTADHFIPGLAVDNTTQGTSAHLALAYYSYPNAHCTVNTCRLSVGYVTSDNGGTTWTQATQLGWTMSLKWLPNTTQGRMVGDYISTSFVNHVAQPFFALARQPTSALFDEAIYTTR